METHGRGVAPWLPRCAGGKLNIGWEEGRPVVRTYIVKKLANTRRKGPSVRKQGEGHLGVLTTLSKDVQSSDRGLTSCSGKVT